MFRVIRITPLNLKIVRVANVATQTDAEDVLNLADFWLPLNDFYIILTSTPENQRGSIMNAIIAHDERRSMVLFNNRIFYNWCKNIDPSFYEWIDATFIKYY